jgi:hypothetical protein
MPGSRALSHWLLAASLSLAPVTPAAAATIQVNGAPGTPGVAGAPGNPGGDGTAGGAGGAAASNAADPNDPRNLALATGGSGGAGGDGGTGVPSGSAPGEGGAGGAGGSASATATTSLQGVSGGGSSTGAFATGGRGGSGGLTPAGGVTVQGPSGNGGDADASASISGSAAPGVFATAFGGDGSDGAIPGSGGTARIGYVSVTPSAGTGQANAGATAKAGNGGANSVSTDAASGHQGDGGDASVVDAISSGLASSLGASQMVFGGSAGRTAAASGAGAGVGGNATNSLTATLTVGDQLSLLLGSRGGDGSAGQASPGRSAGNGGAATTTTDLTLAATSALVNAYARAGAGVGLGNGGTATQQTQIAFEGSNVRVITAASGGSGGSPGGGGGIPTNPDDPPYCTATGPGFCRGGDAASHSTVNGVGTSPAVTLIDFADGGIGGSADPSSLTRQDGAAGGNASSFVSATSEYDAMASASVGGGIGGDGAGPGSIGGGAGSATGSAFASGVHSATAQLSVTGGGGGGGRGAAAPGGDIDLENVPIAESPNAVTVSQSAWGGDSRKGPGSRGGDARSVLTRNAVTSNALELDVFATGGYAGSPDGSGRGGNATGAAEAIGSGSQSVTISATATGGDATTSPGDQGGSAVIELAHGHSDSGSVKVTGSVTGGSGGSVGNSIDLNDVVRGETSGALSLSESATGGNATEIAGDAASRLHESTSSQSLTLNVTAVGGSVRAAATAPSMTHPGNAFAEADGANDQGDVVVGSVAMGGLSPSAFADGGAGEAHATATTSGASAHNAQATTIARAGPYPGPGALPGRSGSLLAVSTAMATGSAFALSQAVSDFSDQNPGTTILDVTARSTARAGPTYYANAKAIATGLTSTMLADATASAGTPGSQALSDLQTRQHSVIDMRAQVTEGAATASSLRTVSRVGGAESLSEAVSRLLPESSVGGYVSGVDAAGSPWVAGNPNVIDSLGSHGSVLAEGLIGSKTGGGDWSVTETFVLDHSTHQHFIADDFRLGFLDPSFPALGLDLLGVHISVDGHAVADMSFTSGAAAQAALDDVVIPIDPSLVSSSLSPELVVQFDVHSSGSSGLLSNFVVMANVTVPEPPFWLLVSIGTTLVMIRRFQRFE